MSKYRKNFGAYGEDLACQFLKRHGYTLLARNFTSPHGELDIIALHHKDPATICCIEVKTRVSEEYGAPEEAVTEEKIKKLHDTACSYFYRNKIEEKNFRLDIISIFCNLKTKKARIKHLKALGLEDFTLRKNFWY